MTAFLAILQAGSDGRLLNYLSFFIMAVVFYIVIKRFWPK